ncbi:UPF0052-domain-containing protein [Biscogniauxia mediterranea]|nr:UPF0052-domain-containing protein [Biscogniauxia mediterranea]
MDTPRPRGIVVFGGGTATNSLVDVFEDLRKSRHCTLSYIIPISDNGGSSSELIRVFGGPGIGDIRSRLVRLIPESDTDLGRASIKELFNHRLSPDPLQARFEWLDIVEGRHMIWANVASEKRELIRSIFNLMNLEIVKRARPSSVFNFSKASIGNLFLTGARVFTGSLESAIYLLSTICGIPPTVTTLPAINSNFTHHISAGLADGSQITGQNAISHPSAPTALPDDPALTMGTGTGAGMDDRLQRETEAHDRIEDATLPGSLPSLRKQYINFSKGGPSSGGTTPKAGGKREDNSINKNKNNKNNVTNNAGSAANPGPSKPEEKEEYDEEQEAAATATATITTAAEAEEEAEEEEEQQEDLPSRIERIWYINPYGHEIWPLANSKVVSALEAASVVIYSVGSLYTSLVPSLVLRGVGAAIASPPHPPSSSGSGSGSGSGSRSGSVVGSAAAVTRLRPKVLILNSSVDRETGPMADPMTATDFVKAIARAAAGEGKDGPGRGQVEMAVEVRRYVTHLIYMEGEGVPKVRKEELAALGVDCVRVYGRRVDGVLRYDEAGLARALEAVVGKHEVVRSRRNTSGQ